ncbi:FAD-dependent oxidoreductase [Myxacorys almedinensis]|uniref:FAD-dependent oxidoreductase n=1 Tax=Myxacorys almedinensis A TaxID=2690445 RepID=A0A8J8CLN0_9CYAN|nr:FAD-dependent oxidoreductase [Myxacorys almedinensis]NDJ16292.1 FAD-dependent oxidoreductase [Myxacorys almedinensis A]
MKILQTEVLVVGGGTGGTAAAIQAARRGAHTILVSEFAWLGGMLTSAGVSAPDGNELEAFQTGLWGAFLRALEQRQPGGLDNAWVSFFTYEPRIGAEIFAEWVAQLANLDWIAGQVPLEVLKEGERVTGVRFRDITVFAKVTIDGTELGDLLALGKIPHRWGWEFQSEWDEPSAPRSHTSLTERYPVQAPTWVVMLKDFGAEIAPKIPPPPQYTSQRFAGAWENYGSESFLNYGRLPQGQFMINWPIHGNDYGEGVERLIGDAQQKSEFLQAALWHAQGFAHFIQTHLGRRYGLAETVFPKVSESMGGGAFALHPYYRESRRLIGRVTVCEQDILPQGTIAPLPIAITAEGCETVETWCEAIAIGNYANDHHYPSGDIPLKPKSMRWGGRWTGTPFTIPYGSLVSATVDGFLVCEKNISVSHIANGATRLQPLVLGIGQAAGMAAALCIEHNCQPRELPVRSLQNALLDDASAPAAIVPLLNLPPTHPDWQFWQHYYLNNPESYPTNGYCPLSSRPLWRQRQPGFRFSGTFHRQADQLYSLTMETQTTETLDQPWSLVTLRAEINDTLYQYPSTVELLTVSGTMNSAGRWLLVESLE